MARGLAGPLFTEDDAENRGSTAWFPTPEEAEAATRIGKGERPQRRFGRRELLALAASAVLGLPALALGLEAARGRPGLAADEAPLRLERLHGPAELRSLHEVQLHQNWSSRSAAPRQLAAACDRLIVRFSELGKQDLHGGSDPEFPDSMLSIAEAGSNCGDSAAGIHESCAKYNHWATFQDVADRMHGHFEVMASKGPDFHDIGQGALGTCYFLAAVASIAHSDPKVVQNMFVERSRWKENVYTTRWLLNGREAFVEVDNKIPAHHSSRPFFVQPSNAGEWWPVILEKAWAKIYGNFHAVEGGLWENAVQAITMAPVMRHDHDKVSATSIFNLLKEASAKGWPMGAGTSAACKKYGLAQGHAYSVLNAWHSGRYGAVVQLYNPWNSDHYKGAVPNEDKGDGIFTMKLAEYHEAFEDSSIAIVHDDYKMDSKFIQTTSEGMGTWEVTHSGSDPFYVTLTWPGHRIVKPCDMVDPVSNLVVTKKGSVEPIAVAPKQLALVSSTSVEIKAGSGTYVILAGLDFPPSDKVHEGHLIVHSKNAMTIKDSSEDATNLLANLFGPTDKHGNPCTVIFLKSQGIFHLSKDRLVHGFPTYWSSDHADFAYWVGSEQKWFLITEDYFDKVSQGHLWSFEKITKDDMSCGCSDSEKGVAGFDGVYCNQVTEKNYKYSNVKCENSQYSKLVQRYCPISCKSSVCSGDVPTLPPQPTHPPSTGGGGECKDEEKPRIAINGELASCDKLGHHCHEYKAVQDACCATCAKLAEHGGSSNEECQDHKPPGIRDSKGTHYQDCSELKDGCEKSSAVEERCCATCKAGSGVGVGACEGSSLPGFMKPETGEFGGCAYGAKYLCWLPAVAKECCETCKK